MSNTAAIREGAGIQSVDRAVSALEVLAESGWSSGADVGRVLGVHRSSALRLLATLARHGLVEQDPSTAKYRLGPRLAQLAAGVNAELDLRREARSVIEPLADESGETVTLDLLAEGAIVSIDQVARSSSVVSVNWLGRRTPLHCTASGKVFLAFGPDSLRQATFERPLAAYTPRTLVERADLQAQLETIRSAGHALATEELEVGLSAIAAPVRSADGQVVAAIDLSGPSHRLPANKMEALANRTRDAAGELSRRLGFRSAVAL